MYNNKSLAYRICCNQMEQMNSEDYYNTIRKKTEEDVTTEKAAFRMFSDAMTSASFISGVTVTEDIDPVERITDPPYDNLVTIQDIFECETILYLHEHNVLEKWKTHKPKKTKEIVSRAFMKYDTMHNSETGKIEPLGYAYIVSECVRGYFDKV